MIYEFIAFPVGHPNIGLELHKGQSYLIVIYGHHYAVLAFADDHSVDDLVIVGAVYLDLFLLFFWFICVSIHALILQRNPDLVKWICTCFGNFQILFVVADRPADEVSTGLDHPIQVVVDDQPREHQQAQCGPKHHEDH